MHSGNLSPRSAYFHSTIQRDKSVFLPLLAVWCHYLSGPSMIFVKDEIESVLLDWLSVIKIRWKLVQLFIHIAKLYQAYWWLTGNILTTFLIGWLLVSSKIVCNKDVEKGGKRAASRARYLLHSKRKQIFLSYLIANLQFYTWRLLWDRLWDNSQNIKQTALVSTWLNSQGK